MIDHEDLEEIKREMSRNYVRDVKTAACRKYYCNLSSGWCEAISILLAVSGIILSFSESIWKLVWLSYIAGGLGCASLAFRIFVLYSERETKARTEELKILLSKIELGTQSQLNLDISADELMPFIRPDKNYDKDHFINSDV